jgi:Fe-S oxidoreductase
MALREEQHSPRGRANLLRAAIDGRLGNGSPTAWAVPELEEALDLCLMCKACQAECPSRVDVARLKSEFLYQRLQRRRPRWRERLIADLARGNRLGARFAPLSNWLLHAAPVRWLLHAFCGIDRRRKLPAFHRRTLADWFARHRSECHSPRGAAVLLADCFTNYHEPWVGRDAVTLLERAGYQVHLANLCCGRTMISKGFLDQARKAVEDGAARLAPYVERGVPVLGTEPSCILALADEWRRLVPGETTTLIARQTQLVESFLLHSYKAGRCELPAAATEPVAALFHGHCHQKAAGATSGTVEALEQLAATNLRVLDAGCCGMAGAFGYESEHYALSVLIAESRLLPALRAQPHLPVVASGFSCRTQIADLTGRRALHPVEWIRRRVFPAETPTERGSAGRRVEQ